MKSAIDPDRYSWADFGRDFYAIEPGLGTVRLFRNGLLEKSLYMRAGQQGDMTSYDFDSPTLKTVLDTGGTLVVNRFDKSSVHAASLCRQFSEITENTTVANAYATKGGTGTFGKHWDTHCVFATQLLGAKRWRIYKPTCELPLAFQTSKSEKASFDGELVFDEVIQAGDILYVPRGWWHEVMPLDNQPSLHLTVGVHAIKIHDYMKWVMGRKMAEDLVFRQSLDAGGLEDGSLGEAFLLFKDKCLDPAVFNQYAKECRSMAGIKQHMDFNSIFLKEDFS